MQIMLSRGGGRGVVDGLQYSAEPVVEGVEILKRECVILYHIHAAELYVTIHGGDKGVGAWRADDVIAL